MAKYLRRIIPTLSETMSPQNGASSGCEWGRSPQSTEGICEYIEYAVGEVCQLFEQLKTNLMSLAILFHFLCAQHVSDINISIIRSLRLFYWITTLVVLFLVRCVLEFRCVWLGVVSVLQAAASACNTDTTPTQTHRNSNTHRTKNNRPMW